MSAAAMEGQAIPVLPSLDFAATETFYNALGFDTFLRTDDFLGVRRSTMELHFWPCDDPAICEASGCYLRVADADALRDAFVPAIAPPARISDIADRPWQMREFYVWDPHGNLLKVGTPVG